MKEITFADYMGDHFEFASVEDKKKVFECWEREMETKVDEFGRVFNQAGTYIADVVFTEREEEE